MRLKTLFYLLSVLLLLASAPAQEAPPEPVVRGLLEHPVQDEVLYFLIPDRFFDGNPENNCGDYEGPCLPEASREEVLSHGYLPSDKGYYHGGDIAGLIQKLDYLESMGVTAIWVGPIFENKPVQEDATNLYGHSSGYHGYWITDFMRVDPHLGSNEEFAVLVEAAHARGIKVFIDIITNHTADVIQYEEGEYSYRGKAQYPYLDVDGEPFDDADYAYRGQEDYAFPEMDTGGFPYTPFVPEGEQGVKNPAWLNDLTLYHNRGNTSFSGENSLYGDFFGLDDLFTARKEVVQGMIEIYRFWIETFNVDGFRIDTTKHVNIEFWQAFGPAILKAAREAGIAHFFAFGEVYDQRPPFLSYFSTTGELQSTIDFAFQGAARNFASRSQATSVLRDLFALDDYYTHAGGNAYAMPTFVGNHDMGRIGFFLQQDQPGASDEELLRRAALAHALMYFARGQPVIYYGDEQGFTGDGGDKDARQDMFPSEVPSYNDDALIGTEATTAEDNFDPTHPLYRTLKRYAEVYAAHLALRRGAQIHRYSSDSAGIYAFSRVDRDDRVEYIVALNNDPAASHTAAVPTYYGEGVTFERILGDAETPESLTTAGGRLELTVPPLGTVIYRAGAAFESEAVPGVPRIAITSPQDNASVTLGVNSWDGHEVLERLEVTAEVTTESYAEVTFA
ncbi:MAG: alpha-amylase family glycosyl hydrolase, partial [Deinococcota bacterium]|nr:alpha-amylase family glycosyl hydrolase [Deinococcota bacterium]